MSKNLVDGELHEHLLFSLNQNLMKKIEWLRVKRTSSKEWGKCTCGFLFPLPPGEESAVDKFLVFLPPCYHLLLKVYPQGKNQVVSIATDHWKILPCVSNYLNSLDTSAWHCQESFSSVWCWFEGCFFLQCDAGLNVIYQAALFFSVTLVLMSSTRLLSSSVWCWFECLPGCLVLQCDTGLNVYQAVWFFSVMLVWMLSSRLLFFSVWHWSEHFLIRLLQVCTPRREDVIQLLVVVGPALLSWRWLLSNQPSKVFYSTSRTDIVH